jgi:hypothetical protein
LRRTAPEFVRNLLRITDAGASCACCSSIARFNPIRQAQDDVVFPDQGASAKAVERTIFAHWDCIDNAAPNHPRLRKPSPTPICAILAGKLQLLLPSRY